MKNKRIWGIVCIFVVVIIIVSFIYLKDMFKEEDDVKYLEHVYSYILSSGDLERDSWGLLKSYDEYSKFLEDNNIDGELDKDLFSNNNYIYYYVPIDTCSESIRGVSKLENNDGNIDIVMDVDMGCGVCAPMIEATFIPIDKDIKVVDVNMDYNIVSSKSCRSDVAYKPILYLYPTYDMDVSVKMEKPEYIYVTYPEYNDGWNMFVKSNGDMYDKSGKYYYALYWEEYNTRIVDFKEGFYVEDNEVIEFLENKLSIIGLNDKEKNEFIMYWLPILKNNKKSLVYFELTDELEEDNRLIISPIPNSLLRVRMHVKKVDKKVSIKEEELESFDRNGFSAVEWGGVIY